MYRIPFIGVALLIGVTACTDTKSTPSGTQSSTTSSVKAAPKKEDQYPPPCHPGCFPAGTAIATPDSLRAIETIKAGEIVTLTVWTGL